LSAEEYHTTIICACAFTGKRKGGGRIKMINTAFIEEELV
jgi:hypothetical protein